MCEIIPLVHLLFNTSDPHLLVDEKRSKEIDLGEPVTSPKHIGCHSTVLLYYIGLYLCTLSPSLWVKDEHFFNTIFLTVYTFELNIIIDGRMYFLSEPV